MEPTYKLPTIFFIALLILGLSFENIKGDSGMQLTSVSLQRHRGGSAATDEAPETKVGSAVADIVRDVAGIQQRSAQLKQRVLLLEAQLIYATRQYQTTSSDLAAVESISRASAGSGSSRLVIAPLVFAPIRAASIESATVVPEVVIAENEPSVPKQAEPIVPVEVVATVVATPSADEVNVVADSATVDMIVEPSIIDEQLAMNDTTLSEIRGGFTTTSGLQISFGIEKVLYINGNLISTTSLNVVDVNMQLPVVPTPPEVSAAVANAGTLPAQAATNVSNAGKLSTTTGPTASSGSGVPAAIPSSSSPASALPTASTATTAPTASTGSASSAASTPGNATLSNQASSNSNAAGMSVIQNGSGNTVQSGTLSSASIGTIVQNTLNNQKIQNVTVISATVNSMEILKTLNLNSTINSAVNDSLRK